MTAELDRAEQEQLLELTRTGHSLATAAGVLGHVPASVNRLLRRDPDFAEQYRAAVDFSTGRLEDVLYLKAERGSLRALEMWLKQANPDRWRDESRIAHQITGPGGGPVQIVAGTVAILREVLTDPATRAGALEMVEQIPAIEARATET